VNGELGRKRQGVLTRGSVVRIATGDRLLAGRSRDQSSSPSRVKNFLSFTSSRPALGPPIQWITGALSPGIKQPGREADYSPPPGADVRKTWV
jgi:hypothetical protein